MHHRGPRAPRSRPPKTELTASERRVLELFLASPIASNKALADTLGCTVKNVEFHMSNIFSKTKTGSRMELLVKMRDGNQRKDEGGTERP